MLPEWVAGCYRNGWPDVSGISGRMPPEYPQKSIASKCIEKEADYLLAVKSNQKNLQKDIQAVIEAYWEQNPVDPLSDSFAEQENTGHGRKEYRCC